jgi:tRNA modification GTPase
MDTIFALSSGAGRAGVAVIRLSGPRAAWAVETMTGALPEPRVARVRRLSYPDGSLIDRALVLWMPAPASFTGEDVAELHVHGGRAVISSTLAALGRLPGLRAAEAGEFTRRAFANGRMDLVEVEGLGDVIAADTDRQLRAALRTASGDHRPVVAAWQDGLRRGMALLEASIDFADEADVPADLSRDITAEIDSVATSIRAQIDRTRRGERLRDGVQVVIGGPPNAGKSSLLNALAGRDVAIVSAEAGTTRDVLEVELQLDGYAVVLVDTAGLREASSLVEREGVRRARSRLQEADLVLWLEAADARLACPSMASAVWLLGTKADDGELPGRQLSVSVRTGQGLDELLTRLGRFAADTIDTDGEAPLFLRERQRQALQRALSHLERATVQIAELDGELAAEELRLAVRALANMIGTVDVEGLLDVIFREFCIGK